jgi:opacity protein-like surface antigen
MKKVITPIIALILFIAPDAAAQLEIGVSYELREEEPKSGFGVRIEKGFLERAPLINLGMRAHFSYFSEQNTLGEGTYTYSRDLTNYDFGADVIAGINVGLIEPYVGVGLGSQTLDIKRDYDNLPPNILVVGNENESNIYWNLTFGSKVSIIPLVKPFVEYRYSNASLSDPELADLVGGRIIFGVVLSF